MLSFRHYIFRRRDYRSLCGTVLILLVMAAVVFFIAAQRERRQLLSLFESRMSASADFRADNVSRQIDRLKSDVRFLSRVQTVAGLARAISHDNVDPEGHIPARIWRRRLEETFGQFAEENPNLSQVRFIGVTDGGRELVRIERMHGAVVAVAEDQLITTNDRDYFQSIVKISAGQVALSPINLGRKNGQIVSPLTPTLRAGVPILAADAGLLGMVVVNLDMRLLLNDLQRNSYAGFQIYLLNNRGDYLLQPDASRTFGFDLHQRWRWQDEHTEVTGSHGQLLEMRDFSSPDGILHAVLRRVVLDKHDSSRDVIIIITLPDAMIAQRAHMAGLNALLIMLGACLIAGGIAYFYRRQHIRATEKQAEQASIVENSRDAIIGKTLKGVVTSWNQGAELLFGYRAQEAIGQELGNLIVPEKLMSEEADILRRITNGEVISELQTVRHRKDGSLLDVSVIVSPIRTADGTITGAAKTVRDISQQKIFESQIKRMNESLERQVVERTAQIRSLSELQRVILENAGYAVIVAGTNGLITLFNPAAERMLGYRADELIGKQTPKIFHDLAEVEARAITFSKELGELIAPGFDVFVAKAIRNLPNEHEWTFLRKDGSRFPVLLSVTALRDESGGVFGFLGMVVDLSERKAAEKTLETNNRFLKTLTDNIPNLIVYWDRRLRCRFANRAYLEWFGKEGQDIGELVLRDLLGAEIYSLNEPHIHAVLQGQAQRFERTLTKADGTAHFTIAHYIPDIIDGQVRGFIVLITDVSDLKHAQLTLEQVNHMLQARTDEAESANRAKSAFLANMSHEIRTPMNAVLGMLQLLQRAGLDRRQDDYASKAESAARALLSIINDILDFSRVEAGKLVLDFHPFSIDKLLRDVAVILSSSIGDKEVEVLFDIDPALPDQVIGDALRLQQILINLAGNAVKFTELGEVVLEVKLAARTEQKITISFAVKDTGIGISAEYCTRIFEGFSQAEASTARRFGGSGLGLTISQRLVQMMGGSLNVDSIVGEGSTFRFAIEFQCAEVLQSAPRSGIPMLQNLRCLVIDDNAAARKMFAEMLSSFGWAVDRADSGADALRLLAETEPGQPYQVVFVDWRMPEMDGWETCVRIRQLLTPQQTSLIVMITTHSREALEQRQAQMPAVVDGLLIKPVTASALFDAVADCHANKGPRMPLPPSLSIAQEPLAGLRILVVDDNEINQQIAGELLHNAGALVQVADCGVAALEAIKAAIPQFDVVLMDIQMPDMDGYAVTAEIRNSLRLRNLPIIAVTANAMAADRDKAMASGMNDHVGKPFDLMQLITVIECHTGRAAGGNTLQAIPTMKEKMKGELRPQSNINTVAALSRLGGNTDLYKTALAGFIKGARPMAERLRHEIAGEQVNAVLRTTHELRGVAGIVGAEQLAGLAKQVEQSLKDIPSASLTDCEELATLVLSIEHTHAAARLVFAQLNDDHKDLGGPLEHSLMLKDNLLKLQKLLQQGDLDAVAIFESLQGAVEVKEFEGFADMEEAMAQLDLPKALAHCRNMLTQLALK